MVLKMDWLILLPATAVVLGVWAFVSIVRAIARREINKVLKGFIVGQVLRPRNSKGQFR